MQKLLLSVFPHPVSPVSSSKALLSVSPLESSGLHSEADLIEDSWNPTTEKKKKGGAAWVKEEKMAGFTSHWKNSAC